MGGYVDGSRMATLERKEREAAGRLEATRLRLGALQAEQRATDAAWSSATFETMPAEQFAILTARRELLARSLAPVQAELARLERLHDGERQALGQATRSLVDAQARQARAKLHGDTRTLQESERIIAALTETVPA